MEKKKQELHDKQGNKKKGFRLKKEKNRESIR